MPVSADTISREQLEVVPLIMRTIKKMERRNHMQDNQFSIPYLDIHPKASWCGFTGCCPTSGLNVSYNIYYC